jgi:ceramide glucosyltransferase
MSAWLLALPAAICGFSAIYLWAGARLVARWIGERTPAPATLPPVTVLRPVKPGVPYLRGKLEQLARALRPGDQLVLGAAVASAELAECASLAQRFPEREIVAVPCREGAAVNPKISKLVQMESECRHGRLIVTDSEALIDAAWLDAFRAEWDQHEADAITTGFRFAGAHSGPQRLDALAALLSLWPGLAVVRRWGRVDFTLGVCTGLRQRDLTEVGGWRAFGEFLAEDRELGAALTARGCHVRLATIVATLDADPLSWRDCWRHQRRVAATYRVSAPKGYAGMWITHGVTAALALALAAAFYPKWRIACWSWAALCLVLRASAARRLTRLLDFPLRGLEPVMLLAGLVETATWLLGWWPGRIWWSARWWRVGRDGRLRALPTAGGREAAPRWPEIVPDSAAE